MAAGRLGLALALALTLSAISIASRAQNNSPSCVLDKCLNDAQNPQSDAPPPPAPIAPGKFDFYVLALSWSPGFCDTGGAAKAREQCAEGANLGFVVHGLWPQFARGYPSDCDPNRPVSSVALQAADGLFPSPGLARHEWRAHGTCTGLSPEAYFASVKRARDTILIPDAFKAPREPQSLAPIDVQRAFVAVNRGLRPQAMAVGCAQDELLDMRFCLAKDLRGFVDCDEVARGACRVGSIAVAPLN
jgi:ribonuclease T2